MRALLALLLLLPSPAGADKGVHRCATTFHKTCRANPPPVDRDRLRRALESKADVVRRCFAMHPALQARAPLAILLFEQNSVTDVLYVDREAGETSAGQCVRDGLRSVKVQQTGDGRASAVIRIGDGRARLVAPGRRLAPMDPGAAKTAVSTANALITRGEYSEAIRSLEEGIGRGMDEAVLAAALRSLNVALARAGRFAEAEAVYQQYVDLFLPACSPADATR